MNMSAADPPLPPAALSASDITLKEASLAVLATAIKYEGWQAAYTRLKQLSECFAECFADIDCWPQIARECRAMIDEAHQEEQDEKEQRERKQQQSFLQMQKEIFNGMQVVNYKIEDNFNGPVGQVIQS